MGETARKPVGRIEIEAERCKACELCAAVCPGSCIAMGDGTNGHGFAAAIFARPEGCTGCAFCAESCPDACIRVWR